MRENGKPQISSYNLLRTDNKTDLYYDNIVFFSVAFTQIGRFHLCIKYCSIIWISLIVANATQFLTFFWKCSHKLLNFVCTACRMNDFWKTSNVNIVIELVSFFRSVVNMCIKSKTPTKENEKNFNICSLICSESLFDLCVSFIECIFSFCCDFKFFSSIHLKQKRTTKICFLDKCIGNRPKNFSRFNRLCLINCC